MRRAVPALLIATALAGCSGSGNYAGPTLIVVPDHSANVAQIVAALEELPAAVTSVFDRPSCDGG